MAIVCYPGLTTIEPASTLARKGYFDPKRFPTVAAFHALDRSSQNAVIAEERRRGFNVARVFLKLISKPQHIPAA